LTTAVLFAAELDEQVRKWRERPLAGHAYPYLIVDARYEKVRRGGRIESSAVLAWPKEHRRRLKSTNMIERRNREFRKRTRKVSIFPNEGSCIRLFGAMCLELSEQWQGEAKRYLNMERR
jgi:transposase-like protein